MSRIDKFEEILNSYERKGEEIMVFNGIILRQSDYKALEEVLKPTGRKPEDLDNSRRFRISDNRLTYLNLDRMNLSVLSPRIGQLAGLNCLCLQHNALREVPDSIGLLENLTRLYLGYNQLAQLPESMKNLTKLECIGLSGNCFESMPAILLELPKLEEFISVRDCSGQDPVVKQLKAKGVKVSILE